MSADNSGRRLRPRGGFAAAIQHRRASNKADAQSRLSVKKLYGSALRAGLTLTRASVSSRSNLMTESALFLDKGGACTPPALDTCTEMRGVLSTEDAAGTAIAPAWYPRGGWICLLCL